MTGPVPAVSTITVLDVYAKQVEMGAQLAVIGERLNAIPDHETRLRALESARARLLGAAVTLSVVASAGGTWLGLILARH